MNTKIDKHQKAALLRDSVYAANDGVITTFAVVAGALGASLSNEVVIILGFSNLVADGISMASGNYLGVKSEVNYENSKSNHSKPSKHALLTFFFFVLAGFIPLFPFLINTPNSFYLSCFMVAVALFLIGVVRSYFTDKHWIRGGFEVLAIGGGASIVAYGIGYLIEYYILR